MKKFAPIAVIALFGVLSMTSCKKDYTCTCTIGGVTYPYTYSKVKKSVAKTNCDNQNTAAAVAGGSCSL